MAVPGYQEFMLPILKLAAIRETTLTEALRILADQLHISPDDQERMLPSGVQTQYKNRVSWALTYLTKSLLIEKTGRARFRIAPRGKEVLETNPRSINNAFLDQFPEYQAFKNKKRVKAEDSIADKSDLSDPERLLQMNISISPTGNCVRRSPMNCSVECVTSHRSSSSISLSIC